MPRPRSLSPARIAAAALAVIDRDGLAGLSMRAVAKELGMSTMALYRYVRDREELEGLVLELALEEVDPTPPPSGSWDARVEAMALRIRDVLGAHPEIVPLTLTHRHSSPGLLRWSETVAGILATGGLRGADRVVALRALLAYLIGAIQMERLGPLSGAGTDVIAALPRSEYPYMADTARHAGAIGPDEEFRRGLQAVLRGLGAS
ncbi:TetR/AcrR family transcriptional regulator C-terminal domain-containing protein [Actinomadura fibrosa]|uniref:TetR/AcrR family transcriptional regulator C-terminal domain-containing protein n=1 Tax=Actinomadura fibrosa TaxID=111802 RepID=A0ABW2XM86_9ACTN|nr:TetR/AcrR family transcriptional regulator C-terminal domain-containing protein [Actinomadura fibrosa]